MANGLKAILERKAGSGTHIVNSTVRESRASMDLISVPLEHGSKTIGSSVITAVGTGVSFLQAAKNMLKTTRTLMNTNRFRRFTDLSSWCVVRESDSSQEHRALLRPRTTSLPK